MFALFEHNEEFYQLNTRARSILSELCQSLQVEFQSVELKRGVEVPDTVNSISVVKSGVARVERDGRVIFFLEPGDCVGPNTGLLEKSNLLTHSPVTLSTVAKKDFFDALYQAEGLQKWEEFLALQFELFQRFVSKLLPTTLPPLPDVRFISPGDPIIIQDTSKNEVYTLLHGTAQVFVQDTEVGEILPGEIFGAMAAPIKSTRSASVLAKTQCVVSALPQEQFLALVNTHPQTVQNLLKTMSRVIMSQNEQILELKKV